MRGLGIATAIVLALAAIALVTVGAKSLGDVKRMVRIHRM
jgi:hypothetical protein